MLEARQRQHGTSGNPDTSQLLLIVSDGRGLFFEGVETVKTAVRQAREANVFLVFIILDNPVNKVKLIDDSDGWGLCLDEVETTNSCQTGWWGHCIHVFLL